MAMMIAIINRNDGDVNLIIDGDDDCLMGVEKPTMKGDDNGDASNHHDNSMAAAWMMDTIVTTMVKSTKAVMFNFVSGQYE